MARTAARSQPRTPARRAPVVPESIVEEAIKLFGERSYPVVGMRDLSKAVGIQSGSLYAHIESKEALLLTIVEQGITAYLEAITTSASADFPADVRLRLAVRAHMRVLAENTERTKVTFNQWHYLGEENRAHVRSLRQQYEDLFVAILQDGIRDGLFRPVPHLKATLLTMIGGLTFAAEWYSSAKSDSPDQLADAICDALLHGLLAKAGPNGTRNGAAAQ